MPIPYGVFLLIFTLITPPVMGATSNFADWLIELRHEAREQGISAEVLDNALTGITPLARVIELDRHQPETTMTFRQYLQNVLPASRIDQARRQYHEQRKLLEEIGARYKIQPRFLVAFWAIESDFGRNQGNFSIIASLATLAYDGRRAAYFRGELLDALRILQRGDITPARMKGSWAGAMGQAQFMPSVFLQYAVDYDGNGRCDIWGSRADVFASAANYLQQIGWNGNETWGTEIQLPDNFDRQLMGLDHNKTMNEWRALGIRSINNQSLPEDHAVVSLVQPSNMDQRIFAIYPNYHVIRKWNRSNYFATAVGLLADAVIVTPAIKKSHTKKINLVDLPHRWYPLSLPRER